MRKRRKTEFLAFSFLFLGSIARAADIFSAAVVGNWSDPLSWSRSGDGANVVPTGVDNVVIQGGHTITVNTTAARAQSLQVQANATLAFSRSVSSELTMTGGHLQVFPLGTLDMGTNASPISGVSATLTLAPGNALNKYGLLIDPGAVFTSRGEDKTLASLASADLSPSATSLQLPASGIVGWKVGDTITISQTERTSPVWVNQTEERVLTGWSGGVATWAGGGCVVSSGVSVSGGLCYTHTAAVGIRVANLTRNVVVRSSGAASGGAASYLLNRTVNPANFTAVQTEFVGLGTGLSAEQSGIYFQNAGGSIYYSTIRGGGQGVELDGGNLTLSSSLLYRNEQNVSTRATGLLTVESSEIISARTRGMFVRCPSRLLANAVYSNAQDGITLRVAAGIQAAGNLLVANGETGLVLAPTTQGADLAFNRALRNTQHGFSLSGSNNVATNNEALANGLAGFQMPGFPGGLAADNVSWENLGGGFLISGNMLDSRHLGNSAFSNGAPGFELDAAVGLQLYDRIVSGFDAWGDSAANGGAGFSTSAGTVVLRRSLLQSVVPLLSAGASLTTYGINFSTGEVQLFGARTQPSGTSLVLDHAQEIYSTTVTAPVLLRGAGHSLTVTAVNGANVVSQAVRVVREFGQWRVFGSASGLMGTFLGTQAGASFGGQFTMDFNEAVPAEGDVFAFALLAGSADAGVQKRLRMALTSSLTVQPGAAFVLRGQPGGPPAVMESLVGGFTFASSGAVTMENAVVSGIDAQGLQLSGSEGVSMSSVTFDNIAIGGGAYVTARDLTANVTSYGMVFDDTPNRAPFSVRVQGSDAALRWYFAAHSGARAGDVRDSDPNQKILWEDGRPPATPPGFLASPGSNVGDVNLAWTAPSDVEDDLSLSPLKGGSFRIFHSTDAAERDTASPDQAQIVLSTTAAAGSLHVHVVGGLPLGLDHFFRLWAVDELGNPSSPVPAQSAAWGDQVTPEVSISAGLSTFGVSWTPPLTMTFNKPMNAGAVIVGTSFRRVKDNLGVVVDEDLTAGVAIVPNLGGDQYAVTTAGLSGNSTYEITVATTAVDVFGKELAAPAVFRFTTLMDRAVRNVVTEGAGGAAVDIPPGALASDGYLAGSAPPPGPIEAATRKLLAVTGDPFRLPLPGGTASLQAFDASGAAQGFSSPVTVSLPYDDDSPRDGVLDGTSVKAKTLSLYWLDEVNGLWVRLPSMVDPASGRVSAPASRFTTFAVIPQSDTDLSAAYAFPSPFVASQSPAGGGITFTGLSQLATIKIYTPEGRLVRETSLSDGSQQWTWNVLNDDGEPVASGVYYYVIENDKESKRGKIGVIK